MLYMIHGIDAPGAADLRKATREEHFGYLADNQAIMVLGGATLADDGVARTGSVLIINVPSREDADKFAADEPFNNAGVFSSVTVTRMRRGQWFPENAPKTAEGE